MKISSVEFAGAALRPGQYPRLSQPEIAFAGRSNVGKSALINRLLNQKIARTSQTPGRTRQLNFFSINRALTFVDLPGYGYAKVAKSERTAWQRLIEDYLIHAPNLCGVVIILDIRRGPEAEETALADFLAYHHRPFLFVATKCDKLKRNQQEKQRHSLRQHIGGEPLLLFSARDGHGTDTLWQALLALTATHPAASETDRRSDA